MSPSLLLAAAARAECLAPGMVSCRRLGSRTRWNGRRAPDVGRGGDGAWRAQAAALLTARRLPVLAGRGAGLERNVVARSGLRAEQHALVENHQAAIEELADLDPAAGVRARARARRNLRPAVGHPHGIVAGDEARVAAAEQAVEIARREPPGGHGERGRLDEAALEVFEEFGEEGVAGLEGVDAAQAQLADETILEGGPKALDAPLGLGRLSLDEANAEVGQDAPEVRRRLLAGELFFQAPVAIVADE